MSKSVRPRAVLVALAGVVPLAWLVQWSDAVVGGTMAAGPFPPLGAFALWGVLLAVNSGWTQWGRGALFSRAEMLVVLSAWIAANMVVGRGLVHPLLGTLAGTTYYARSGAVARAVGANIPDWLAITNKAAARDFFEGHHVPTPWAQWREPLLTWALFFIPFLTTNICLCGIFERVWVRHERLAYPLVALPIEALDIGSQRRLPAGFLVAFRFGLAVPLLLHGFGIAHAYLPAIPCVSFFNDVSDLLQAPPLSAARPLYVNLYPLLIGLSFLAPTDITLSVWFFLLLNKIELVMTAAAGWNDAATGGAVSSPPFLEEQSAGAYLVLGALLVWSARRHLNGIGRAMYGAAPSISASEPGASPGTTPEINSYEEYRALAWGFWVGLACLLAWGVRTGLPFWFTACYLGFYLVVALVLSRLMAEGGISWVLAPIMPDKLILSLVGSTPLSPVVITRLALYAQHLRDTRQMLAPAVFETGKLRDEADWGTRKFYGLLLAVTLLALAVGVAFALPTFYRNGALSMAPNSDGLMMSTNVIPLTGVNQASERLLHRVKPSSGAAGALVIGAAVTWALAALRTRFLWWPLHPLGYALTGTLQVGYANKMLLSIFLGWLFKTLTLRFGGARGFRLMRGAALGLVLGDLLVGCLLKVLDALLGPSGYALF